MLRTRLLLALHHLKRRYIQIKKFKNIFNFIFNIQTSKHDNRSSNNHTPLGKENEDHTHPRRCAEFTLRVEDDSGEGMNQRGI